MHRSNLACLLILWLFAPWPIIALASDLMSAGLTPQEVQARLDRGQAPLVVDVRDAWEFAIGHIPGARNIPVAELPQHLDELRGSEGVLIYCINGARTRDAEPVLLDAGIAPLYHLEGTFTAWIRAGLGVEKGPSR